MENIDTLVYTSDLEKSSFINKCKNMGINFISVVDPRSAVYVATGICAQNQKKVAVCLDSGNASRSAFSGMTEAFYRKLPVALITVGKKLDYEKELKDVVIGHYTASNFSEVQLLMSREFPMHIELTENEKNNQKIVCDHLQQVLASVLNESDYLFISQGIMKSQYTFKSKVVYGGMPDCHEGALSNVLGASLAKIHKRYIGLVSENELIHDINTLGNININDLLLYIVIVNYFNKTLIDYATAMNFEVITNKEKNISDTEVKKICLNFKKTLFMVEIGDM